MSAPTTVAAAEAAATPRSRTVSYTQIAAVALGIAGVLHLLVAGMRVPGMAAPAHGHFSSHNPWWGDTLFLGAVGLVQLAVAWSLWVRPRVPAMVTGVVVNVVTLGVYVVSRTSGLPVGPGALMPEAVGLLDLTIALLEVAAIGALVVCLPRRARSVVTNGLLLVALLLVVGRVTGVLAV